MCNKVSMCFGRVPTMNIFSASDIRVSGRRYHHSILAEGTVGKEASSHKISHNENWFYISVRDFFC